VNAVSGERKKPHLIDQSTCIRCGACYDACRFDAIEIRAAVAAAATSAARGGAT
jgi:NAD-dependent dihydropyrimidine dehydrogenase PreA subunit